MVIRRTASQIKLVVVINNQYRVYNLLTEKVTWFRYKHQMLRHYGDNNMLIDVSNGTILNGQYEGKQIGIRVGYRKYKTFAGNIIDEETADTQNLVILENIRIARAEESTLHEQIATRLTLVRYLHGNLRFITEARFTTRPTANPVLTYHLNPANCRSYGDVYNAQSTRPYNMHITVSDVFSILNGWEEDRYHTDIPLNGNSTTFTSGDGVRISGNSNTTTYTAPPQEEIRTDLIRRYHSGGTIRPKNGTNDDSRRYFGIELEIDNPGSYNERLRNKMATRLHNLLNESGEYNELVKFENDGSLGANGIEMIFQPMSYKYIIESQEKLFRALKTVDTTGYSSHDAGTCGFHIHVSRTEIPNEVLDRILMIFENFKNELIAFSRRNEEQMRWCKFMCTTTRSSSLNKESFEHARRYGSINGHGYVINNQNSQTVEFRLFRGTTNKRTFMAAIQLVDNIVSIAQKRETIEGLTWLDIINYNEEYTELKEYNVKRSIYSTHVASEIIDVSSTNLRAVVLVRPHQLRLEGDR